MHYDKCYVRDMNGGLGELRDELEVGRCWKDLCGASDIGAWPRTVKNGFPKGGWKGSHSGYSGKDEQNIEN